MDSPLPLLSRLRRYVSQMAPHHRDREGGKLIIEATAAIKQFQTLTEDADRMMEQRWDFPPLGTWKTSAATK